MPDTPVSDNQTASNSNVIIPTLRRRMAAWLYEGMLMFAVSFTAGYLYSSLTQQHHAMHGRSGLMVFLFIVFGIYFGWFWQKGYTIAMKTWKIKVVHHSGAPLTQTQAVIRYLLSWMWFLPALLIAYFLPHTGGAITLVLCIWILCYALLSYLLPQRQFLHDILAGSRLIHFELPEKPKKSKYKS